MAKDDPKARILESLFVKGRNIFHDDKGDGELSRACLHYIGGFAPRERVLRDKRATASGRHLRIDELPRNLSKALDELEKHDLMRDTLGDHIFDHFVAAKRTEWDTTSGTCRRGKSNAI
jgi:glutamine synthetase